MKKTYIGDGIYAEMQGLTLILTTENGIATTNRIVIEWEEMRTLLSYAEQAWQLCAAIAREQRGA